MPDAEHFASLVERYQSSACSIALAIVGNVEASEEIAQDALLQAWRKLPTLREPERFGPWLRTLVRNRSRDWLRRSKTREGTPGFPPERPPDASEELTRHEDARLLAEAIGELPRAAREVVLLYYREGQSVREVADRLEIPEAAVRKRMSRARARLRARLNEVGEAARRTAPTAAFTAAVLAAAAAITPGAASAAAAGIIGWKTVGLAAAGVVAIVLLGTGVHLVLDEPAALPGRSTALASVQPKKSQRWLPAVAGPQQNPTGTSSGFVCRGRVVDAATGDPVQGEVTVHVDEEARASLITGKDGRFEWPVGNPGPVEITASAPGFRGEHAECRADASPVLRLVPAVFLAGTVVDTDGQPIAGARVSCAHEKVSSPTKAVESETGRFEIDDCGPGNLVLVATARETRGELRLADVVRGTRLTNLRIVAAGALRLRVRVVHESGTPVAKAAVLVVPGTERWVQSDHQRRAIASGLTDDAGFFESPALPAGVYRVYATDRQRRVGIAPLTLVADRDELRVELDEGVSLTGTVLGSDGPIQGARVQLRDSVLPLEEKPWAVFKGEFLHDRKKVTIGRSAAKTNAEGGFSFEHLEPGASYNVVASHPVHGRVGIAATPETALTIRLQPGATVVGDVVDAKGQPTPMDGRVQVIPKGAHERIDSVNGALTDGLFTVPHVPAGPAAVVVLRGGKQPYPAVPITVPAQGEVRVRVQLPAKTRYIGRVVDVDGKRVVAADVSLFMVLDNMGGMLFVNRVGGVTDRDGNFDIEAETDGTLTVEHAEGGSAELKVEPSGGPETDVGLVRLER